MKKRFYRACSFAFLAWMTSAYANAQLIPSVQRTHNTPTTHSVPRTVRAQEIEEQVNEMTVPISVLCHNNSGGTDQFKAEYDQKGRICRITFDDAIEFLVTYVENAEGKWTTKSTSVRMKDEELHRLKTERTFDDKGRTSTIEEAAYDFDSKQWTPTHSYAYDYDMSHIAMDPDVASDGDALLTKDISYQASSNGIPYAKGFEYVWYEPRQEYIKFEQSLGNKIEYQLDGNTFCWSNISYDENTGEITSAQYNKEEVQEGEPQLGYYTIIDQVSDDNKNWEIIQKRVMTTNYYAPFTPGDTQKRELTYYHYDEDTQQFYFDEKYVEEWVDHPTLKLVKSSDYYLSEDQAKPSLYDYYQIDEHGRTYKAPHSYLALSNNGDYSIFQGNSHAVNITLFSVQGEKKRQVRIIDTSDTFALAPCIVEELKDGEWVPLRNESLKSGDMGLVTLSFKTNENGYITSQKANLNGESNSEYTYNDMGYTFENYSENGENEPKHLRERAVCTKTSENAFEIIYTFYENDGSVASNKRDVYQDGVIYSQEWDNETNDWSAYLSTSVAPEVTTEDDGTTTTIYRTYTNGKVVNSSKEVERTYCIPNIKMKIPANPMPEVIPAEFFSDIHRPMTSIGISTTYYEWNQETNQWDVTSEGENDYSEKTNATTGDITHYVKEDDKIYVYSVDSKGRLTGYQDENHSLTYSYNNEGLLAQITEDSATGTQSYVFSYGKITVTDGISIPNATVHALSLHVDGRTITLADGSNHALGSKSLQLYSLDGKLAAKSQAGSVTAPTAGTYVVVADGVKAKISVK